jgi:hypothetical protein
VKKFVSPVAQKLDKVTKTAVSSTAAPEPPSKAIDKGDLLIAIIIKVAKSGTRLRLRDVANSFSVSESHLRDLVRQNPALLSIQNRSFLTSTLKDTFLICYKYNVGKCKNTDYCQRLHLCARWLFGKCTSERCCDYEHDIFDDHNFSKLVDMGTDDWEQDKLKLLILGLEDQVPVICRHYNNQGCSDGASCDCFHVCAKFVERKCSTGETCQLSHRLHQFENKRKIQEMNGFKWFDEFEQLRARLGLKLSTIPKSATYDVLVTQKMNKNRLDQNTQRELGRSDKVPHSGLVYDLLLYLCDFTFRLIPSTYF